jgi:16S rRNA (guanine966-N2)-methyltransferase
MPKSAPLKHQVRIIAGQYRRRLLPVVAAPEHCHLRPTPDRVRQTVFNWLEYFLPSWQSIRVVDAFAGTGALGFEAASRGAKTVLLCESFVPAARNLQSVVSLLQADSCIVHQGDALSMLTHRAPASVDLLLLDPPFHSHLFATLKPQVLRILAPNGWVYAESETLLEWPEFECVRHLKAGTVQAQLLRRIKDAVDLSSQDQMQD